MRKAKRLGRRYIRTLSDILANAFLWPRFRERVAVNITRNNALLARLMRDQP